MQSYMDVRLFWDGDDLGPCWMNLDNLKLLLFSNQFSTKPELLAVAELDHSYDHESDPDPAADLCVMLGQLLKDIGVAPHDMTMADLERWDSIANHNMQGIEELLEALREEEEVLQHSFEVGECAIHKLTGTCVMVLDTITYSLEDNEIGYRDGYWVRFQDDKEPRKVFDFELMKRE